MHIFTTIRIAGFATLIAALPALIAVAVNAQTPAPAPASEGPSGAVKIVPPAKLPAPPPAARDIKAVNIGATVVGSDGQTVGEVKGVKSDPAGVVEEIHVKTGGILGFGGRVVIIPAAQIAKSGATVLLVLSSAEVGKLPVLTDKNG